MAPVDYFDFELVVGPGTGHEYPVKALASPGGEARETMRLPSVEQVLGSCLEDLQGALFPSAERGGKRPASRDRAVQDLGQWLFDSLCAGEVRSLYDASRDQAAGQGKGLRLKLSIQPPELAALPWEYVYDSRLAEFAGLSRTTSLARYLERPGTARLPGLTPPLRILGVVASPRDLPPLDVRREKRRLEEATSRLQAQDLVELQWLEGPAWRDLQQAIWTGQWHVLHFAGHGGFDQDAGEGYVILAGDRGQSQRVGAAQLAWLLAGQKSLQLAWFSSCPGTRGNDWARFASMAAVVVGQGVPAALAMQVEMTERAAVAFARTFYGALTATVPLDLAVAEARTATLAEGTNAVEWGIPVLYTHSPDLRVFDQATLAATASLRGDEALAGDDFEKAAVQYQLATDMGADPVALEKKELAEEAHRKLGQVQDILSAPAGSAETRADGILEVLKDLKEVEQRLPDSRAVQDMLLRARKETTALRNRLWQDGRQLMAGRAVGRTLGQRRKRTEESVRLLEKARELDQEGLPALAEDLSKATYRLSYLQNAQRQAKAQRLRRLPVYGLLGVVAAVAIFLLCFAFDLVSMPAWLARVAPATTPVPGQPAIPAAVQTAAPTPGQTSSPVTAQEATATPGQAAGPAIAQAATPTPGQPASLATVQAATPTPGETASPIPSPAATHTPGATATAAPSPTPRPTATHTATATQPPQPTRVPTARPRRATPTRSPTPAPTRPTPRPAYPAPELLQPEDVVFLSQGASDQYTMRWQWDGALQADEWFDVRVWQDEMPHYGLAWTKQREYVYDLCLKGNGYFFWSIAVIRGQDGQWLADLSPEATPRSFSSSRSDQWCARNGRSFPGSLP